MERTDGAASLARRAPVSIARRGERLSKRLARRSAENVALATRRPGPRAASQRLVVRRRVGRRVERSVPPGVGRLSHAGPYELRAGSELPAWARGARAASPRLVVRRRVGRRVERSIPPGEAGSPMLDRMNSLLDPNYRLDPPRMSGSGRRTRRIGSRRRPTASRDTMPSRALSPFWPKITGEAPRSPLMRKIASPIGRVISVPSARMKDRVPCGRIPSLRSIVAGTTE